MDKANKKTERFEMRMTPKFKQMATRKSDKARLTLSEYITKLIKGSRP